MAVAFDSAILTILLNPGARVPDDPATGSPVSGAQQRVQGLVRKLQKSGEKIVIPTPVVAEVLTVAGSEAMDYFDIIGRARAFQIVAFDTRSALELSILNRDAWAAQDKRDGLDTPYQKLKIDRQILAICKVAGATTLYTDDKSLRNLAERSDISVVALAQIPIPDEDRQLRMELEQHEELPEAEDDGSDESAD